MSDYISRQAAIDETQNGMDLDRIKSIGVYVPNNVEGNKPMESYILRNAAINEIYHHFPSLSHTEAAMVLHTVPSADVVPRSIFEQVKWERDVAMKQLEDLGIGFGEEVKDVVEVVRCGECKHLTLDGRCLEFADDMLRPSASDYCSYGERRTDER